MKLRTLLGYLETCVDDDITLGDDIGILILGIDEPHKPTKKYLALDYNCTYFPIVDDEIQFPEE